MGRIWLRCAPRLRCGPWYVLLATLMAATQAAQAGPPLLSDDPHTVGPGRSEAILAVSGFGCGDSAEILVPTVDLTVGVFEGVDLTALVTPSFALAPDAPVETGGSASIGVKWQPLRGEHWNAAFTPSATLNVALPDEVEVLLPVEIEYGWKRFSLGVDAGYVVDLVDSDLWLVALYGGWQASDSLTLLAEIWGGRDGPGRRRAAGLTLGLDWVMVGGLHLLAAAGPGYQSSADRSARWDAYLGLQWDFTLWSRR